MKQSNHHILKTLAVSSVLIASTGTADDSPMDYFAEQDAVNAKKNAPILSATTTDELIKAGAIPKEYAASLAEMSDEEIAEFIDSVKQNLDSGRAVAEKIDGNRAVVLRESAYAGAWNKVVKMTRTNGAWTPSGETLLQSDSGANGSFTVSGVASAELTNGQVVQSGDYYDDGVKSSVYLTLKDILGENLDGREVPTVSFNHPGCLTLGKHSIANLRGGFTTAGASMVDAQSFNENRSGTMEVTRIEDDRFWASFEMTAVLRKKLGSEPDPAQTVSVTGTINNASNLCPGGGVQTSEEPVAEEVPASNVAEAATDGITGVYGVYEGGLRVEKKDGQYVMSDIRKPDPDYMPLTSIGENLFSADYYGTPAKITFSVDDNGQGVEMSIEQEHGTLKLPRK